MNLKEARKILGLAGKANIEEVKKRYKDLAREWHPDLNDSNEANIKMQEINKAFELVMKEEFDIIDPWNEYHKWWWRQYGNDPIWGNYIDKEGSNEYKNLISHHVKSPKKVRVLKKQKKATIADKFLDGNNVFAVVGASNNPKKYGNKIYHDLKGAGYKVYPVNPRINKIQEDNCYPSLMDLPELPDVVDTVIPPEITEKVVKEVSKLGIKKVWMQPGSESDNAISFCKKNNIKVLHDVCVMVERRR